MKTKKGQKGMDTGMDTFGVTFTPEKLKLFQAELAKQTGDDDVLFSFEGKQWLVSYAKYLASFLEGKFFIGITEYKK